MVCFKKYENALFTKVEERNEVKAKAASTRRYKRKMQKRFDELGY